MTEPAGWLADHVVLRSEDPDEVRHEAEGLLAGHAMTVRSGTISADIRGVEVGRCALLRFSYGAEVEIDADPLLDLATIHIPVSGSFDLTHVGRTVHADESLGAVISPGGRLAMRWSPGLSLLVMRVSREALVERMAAITGVGVDAAPQFEPELDVHGAGAALVGVTHAVRRAVDDSGPSGLPSAVAREFERTVTTLLLLSHPHRASRLLTRPVAAPTPRPVRAVVDYVEAHRGEFFSVAELAAVAGVGERTLVAAFRRHLDTTPAAYLRGVRLDQAYRELLTNGAAAGESVTAIALRNGFAHLGRFASHFRRRFGESPSEVLRR